MKTLPDLVFLLPGFLGFNRIAGFSYFADRVSATLRGALELALGESVPVVPLDIEPTGALRERQATLLAGMDAVLARLARDEDIHHVERLHLVGHSTGGVDAALLLRQHPLVDGTDADLWRQLRGRVRSSIAISAPFQGSSGTLCEAARFYADPLDPREVRRLPATAEALVRALQLYLTDPPEQVTVSGFLHAAGAEPADALRFLQHVFTHRGLIDDLQPQRMTALWRDNPRDPALRVPQRSFVTLGPRPSAVSDPLYTHLHGLIGAQAREHADDVAHAALQRLRAWPQVRCSQLLRGAGPCSGAVIELFDNDGVVDCPRQLLDPASADELRGVIFGDHADVIGRYDNIDKLMTGRPLRAGVFHSGALFSDGTFFRLLRDVAALIQGRALEDRATRGPDFEGLGSAPELVG